jgi:hypothetical protein
MSFHRGTAKAHSIDHHVDTNEYDEEIKETEDDLMENYLYLTRRCGLLRHSPTTNTLSSIQQARRSSNTAVLTRQYSWATDRSSEHFDRKLKNNNQFHRASSNDLNNNNCRTDCSISSRIPPTIHYDDRDDENGDVCSYTDRSFSLVKTFARLKTRLKHDRRYTANSSHQLLHEEDPQEWFELTKNTQKILTKALLPDGGYDVLAQNYRARRCSQKKARDTKPVLCHDDEDDAKKIAFEFDETLAIENDQEFDQIIWNQFQACSRGTTYRRCGVCKAIDRQHFQGQLVYVYGVANNILIDENLKASGLG